MRVKVAHLLAILVVILLVSGCIGEGDITGGASVDRDIISGDTKNTWVIDAPSPKQQQGGLEIIT